MLSPFLFCVVIDYSRLQKLHRKSLKREFNVLILTNKSLSNLISSCLFDHILIWIHSQLEVEINNVHNLITTTNQKTVQKLNDETYAVSEIKCLLFIPIF